MDKPGPTDDFPQPRLNEADEGGLMIEIGEEAGNVVIRFGKKVAWIGMDPDFAIRLARTIVMRAATIKVGEMGDGAGET